MRQCSGFRQGICCQQILKRERLADKPLIVGLGGWRTEIVAGPGGVTGYPLDILTGGLILPGIQPGIEKLMLFVLRVTRIARILLQECQGCIGVLLLQIRGNDPADCPARHRMVR